MRRPVARFVVTSVVDEIDPVQHDRDGHAVRAPVGVGEAVLECVHRRADLHVEQWQRRSDFSGKPDVDLERDPDRGIDHALRVESVESGRRGVVDEGATRIERALITRRAVVRGSADAVLVLRRRVAMDLDQIERRQWVHTLEVVVADTKQQRHAREVVHEVGRGREQNVVDQGCFIAAWRERRCRRKRATHVA